MFHIAGVQLKIVLQTGCRYKQIEIVDQIPLLSKFRAELPEDTCNRIINRQDVDSAQEIEKTLQVFLFVR